MLNPDTQWHPVAKTLHWLLFLFVLAALVAVTVAHDHEAGSPERIGWVVWHLSFGITALVLMVAWLMARPRIGRPAPIGAPWQRRLASLVHWGMVALVIVMPLAGLLMAQFSGHPVSFYHLVPIPPLLPANEALAERILALHKSVGAPIFVLLVLVHIAGALWHHLVDKDVTLKRILPGGG